ncbi:hypothetical protein [Streptomyces broussonetiae]|uniref:hypothetical protein n=1 Tax=Streptomyces broussonetiae TaxID=2686304 RepID=UPI0035D69BCD
MNTDRPDDDAQREPTGDTAVGEGAAVDEDAEAGRGARRRSRALVFAVAAAVLVAGGGGAYLATSASGGSGAAPGAGGTPPPLALDGYADGGGTHGIAPGEPDPNGVTYRASGTLPDGPDSAAVYRARGEVTEAEVARLAAALGLEGRPVAEGQAWRVGGQDGSGPSLQVNRRAPGTWTFHRHAPGSDDCQGRGSCTKGPGATVDPVDEGAARKAAAPVLKAVGQDDAKIDASQVMGAQRMVNADPVIGGLPTHGWPTGVTVDAQGEVVGGSGQLKAPVKGDTYPVITAEESLELMNDAAPGAVGSGRAGIGGCASPVPLEDRGPCEGATVVPEVSAAEPVEVESAVFGLASHFVQTRQTLVPSWLFEVRAPGARDAFTVTYPAVEPEFLTAPAVPSEEPPAQPSPRPTGPDDEPTAAPSTRDLDVDAYTAEGTELTVAFTAGVCADYTVTVTESARRVTVKVTEKPWKDKVCILIAKVHHRTVQLDEPLGDRKVVGTDGAAVPLEKPGARLPR